MTKQLAQAFVAFWLVLSLLALGVLVAPFVLDEDSLLEAGRLLQTPHHGPGSCALCGMTRAFAAIARGHFRTAAELNGWSLPLFGLLAGNEFAACTYLFLRARRAVTRKPLAPSA